MTSSRVVLLVTGKKGGSDSDRGKTPLCYGFKELVPEFFRSADKNADFPIDLGKMEKAG
jgi:hypothetical protein